MNTQNALQQVKDIVNRLRYYEYIDCVLDWDYWTSLPVGSKDYAGRVGAYFQSSAVRDLLSKENKALAAYCRDLDLCTLDDYQRGAVRFFLKSYDDATKVSPQLKEELAEFSRCSQVLWSECQKKADWVGFCANVQKMFDLKTRVAEAINPLRAPYDVLIGETDAGMDSEIVGCLFSALRDKLIDLLAQARRAASPSAVSLAAITAPMDVRKKLIYMAAERTGFDFGKAAIRQGQHPLCLVVGPKDVRLTLNYDLPLFGTTNTLHECGHGMYGYSSSEQAAAWGLWGAVWGGFNESQARFNENIIGKSREFWIQLYPEYCREIPALSKFTFDEFYTSLIHPQPSTCRMIADELTYTLHIIIRFELERDVFAGKLTVNELEDAWNDKYQRYLGVCPSNPREGILQDIHWASGHVGYFQSYALGDMYAAQIKAKLMQAVPDAFSRLANGDGSAINKWLQQNVWQYGMTYTPEELIVKATGAPLSAQHLIDHLTDRYLPNK